MKCGYRENIREKINNLVMPGNKNRQKMLNATPKPARLHAGSGLYMFWECQAMKNKWNASIERLSGDNKISIIWLRLVEINRKKLPDSTLELAQPHARSGLYRFWECWVMKNKWNASIERISGDNKISNNLITTGGSKWEKIAGHYLRTGIAACQV